MNLKMDERQARRWRTFQLYRTFRKQVDETPSKTCYEHLALQL